MNDHFYHFRDNAVTASGEVDGGISTRSREFLADVAGGRIPTAGISNLYFACTPGGSVPSRRATIHDSSRLIVCLEGRRHHSFVGPRGPVSLVLEPGQALFVAPECWLDTWYDCDNDALSVVFGGPRVRVLYLRYRWVRDRGATMRATPNPAVFVGRGVSPDLERYFDELAVSRDRPGWYAANVVECLLYHLSEAIRTPEPGTAGKAEVSYQLVRCYVDEHCQEALTRDVVSRALGMHPSHVSRLFSRFSASSFSEYLNETRMVRALHLLADTSKTIAEVAYQCGFASPSYFTRVFRRRTGRTPLSYRIARIGTSS